MKREKGPGLWLVNLGVHQSLLGGRTNAGALTPPQALEMKPGHLQIVCSLFFFFFLRWGGHVTRQCGILGLQPGIKPVTPALEVAEASAF